MKSVIPPVMAFRFAFPVRLIDALPRKGKRLLDLPEDCRVLWPGEQLLDSGAQPGTSDEPGDRRSRIDLRMAWNSGGLAISCRVFGKRHPPVSNPDRPDQTDGVHVWIDTRDTQTIHRANRYCHQFCLLPNGGGHDGMSALVRQVPVGRAIEDAPLHAIESFRIWSALDVDGYGLEAWLPASTLNGFDPEICPRLGFFCLLKDAEHGELPLTVGADFPFATDPSLWQTLELACARQKLPNEAKSRR